MKILLAILLALSLSHVIGNTIMAIGKDIVTMESSIPPKDNSIGPGRLPNGPPNGYIPLTVGENNATIGQVARSLLGGEFGTTTPFRITTSDGKSIRYMARVEPHYHPPPPPNTPQDQLYKYPKPWNWHKGVTIYKADPSKATLEDYIPESSDDAREKLLQRIDEFYRQFGIKN